MLILLCLPFKIIILFIIQIKLLFVYFILSKFKNIFYKIDTLYLSICLFIFDINVHTMSMYKKFFGL